MHYPSTTPIKPFDELSNKKEFPSPQSPPSRKRPGSAQKSPVSTKRQVLTPPVQQAEAGEEKSVDTLFKQADFPGIIKAQSGRTRGGGKFRFYGLAGLCALIKEVEATPQCRQGIIRFLMRKDGKLLFAKEGAPASNYNIPAHYHMTGMSRNSAECIAAGNLMYTEKDKSNNPIFNEISNKSGDFSPDFNNLQYALYPLLENCRFSEVIQFEKYANRCSPLKLSPLDLSALKKEIDRVVTSNQKKWLLAANKDVDTVQAQYDNPKDKQKCRTLEGSTGKSPDEKLANLMKARARGTTKSTLFSRPDSDPKENQDNSKKTPRKNLSNLFR